MARGAVALDTETYRIRPGLLIPALVCGSTAWATGDPAAPTAGALLDKADTLALLREALAIGPVTASQASSIEQTCTIWGANVPYDLAVLWRRATQLGEDIAPAIFQALDDGRIGDIQTAEALDAIAQGCLNQDPRTGGPLINPETGRRGAYALATCVDLVLGRTDAKANDEHRLRYGELDAIPMADWPPTAKTYPVDDGRNTLEVALAQAGHLPRAGAHFWGPRTTCEWCGVHPKDAYDGMVYRPCRARRRSRNLHDLANQVGTAFAMHLGAAWGFRIDQGTVDIIEQDALEGRAEAAEPFIAAGLLRRNRDGSTSKDTSAIARRVALAYGADPRKPCATCRGTRKIISPKAKPVRCPTCKGVAVPSTGLATASTLSPGASITCIRCAGARKIPDPKALINCTDCAATGLDFGSAAAASIPLTPTGRVAAGRDPLNESGDETLIDLADHFEGAKTLDVYVPYWRRARQPVAGHATECPQESDDKLECTCPGPYRDIPLTLRPRVLLETGRTAYGDVIQLLPRKGGHWSSAPATVARWSATQPTAHGRVWIPSLREAVRARPGMIFSSEDYEAGELITHAQSCLWICGESRLAEALVGGKKVHNLLGSQMLGMSYEDFQRRVKETACKDARQAAKPGNFGLPGGMGAVKMVQTQRRQGPDTPHPRGPTMIRDEDDHLLPGYRGLRFCILMDGAEACGVEKVTTWRDRPIAPTCARCIECAIRLKQHWLDAWPENQAYFAYVQQCVEHGQLIGTEHLELWPHLAEWFTPGQRLAPGEIMQHVSGRIRQVAAGSDDSPFCKAANGFFQGLLADAAKSALRRITRECYDRTVRVPSMAHENSTPSAYAGGPSPLWGSRPILFAHDEIISEHPESMAHDGAMRKSEIMVEELAWYCPDLAPACKAEPTLMRRWFKGAQPRWARGGDKRADASDRLVPWEPKIAAAA